MPPPRIRAAPSNNRSSAWELKKKRQAGQEKNSHQKCKDGETQVLGQGIAHSEKDTCVLCELLTECVMKIRYYLPLHQVLSGQGFCSLVAADRGKQNNKDKHCFESSVQKHVLLNFAVSVCLNAW
jgi:hypothetical protein